MRSLWVGLWALLSLLRLVAGQDVEGGTEEYSLVVVSDVDDDLQTQYILYLNTSSERIGKEALRFLNVPLAGDPNDKTTRTYSPHLPISLNDCWDLCECART